MCLAPEWILYRKIYNSHT